jgi:DNA-binding NtrC family response regulator
MVQLNKQIGLAVSIKASVLLTGETGTGKGVVARLIHTLSDRKDAPFITLDCGSIPETLFEDALFGHEKGAYTDAKDERSGAFERADGGTLFLDEVSNMTPAQQGTLLTVLQEREFQRVGSNRTRSVDVRVISATNENLKKMMEEEKFRTDLYYRLCDYEISIPSLRDRIEDISLLTTHFLQLIEKENERQTIDLSPEAEALLKTYNWPGNVRELYSCLKRAAINSRGHAILSRDLPEGLQTVSGDEDSRGSVPKTPEKPIYQNMLDLPIAVFCQFISKVVPYITDKQISLWWKEFSNDGRDSAYKAKRETEDLWKQYYTTTELDVPELTEEIKKVIDDAISQFSEFRYRIDSELIEEAQPICIRGKSHKDSFTEILREIVKEYDGNKQKAAKELRTSLETLDTRLLYRTEADVKCKTKVDGNDTEELSQESEPTLSQIERFPIDEIMRLHTEPIKDFILENLSRAEWRNKGLKGQMRTVHLALKVLSKRLGGEHGYIDFGGLIFPRIEWNIYRRSAYLYADIATAAKVLDVTPTTFKKYWDENKPFPSHHTLFTG